MAPILVAALRGAGMSPSDPEDPGCRGHTASASNLATGEIFNTIWDYKDLTANG
jgi:hypothetical protein